MKRAPALFLIFLNLHFALPNPMAGTTQDPHRVIAILENERRLEAEPDVKLVDFFQSNSGNVRLRSIFAAARIGNPDVLKALEPLSRDKSVSIRRAVAFALGQIRSKKGLSTTISLLKDSNMEVRRMALDAVGRTGGLESSQWIVPFLNDQEPAIREQAALALALIKDQSTVDDLIPLTKRRDPAQWSYVYALYRLSNERSVPVLHHVLANPSPSPSTDEPSSLLFALKALWSMKKPLKPGEVKMLLRHQDPRVQQNALDVLAASVDKSSCETIHGTYSTFDTLTKMKALETMGALECVTEQRPASASLFGVWVLAKAKAGKEKALPLLQEASKHQTWTVRWRAAQALGELPATSSIPLLKPLSKDEDSAVRLAALDSLAKYLPETADLFVPLLQSKDFAVRATAVDALGKTKDPKFLPLLIQTYDVSRQPSETEARVALLDVLADFQTSESLQVFEKALFDPEYTIRRHAIDGLKKMLGSMYYRNGTPADLEDFLHHNDKVMLKTLDQYPLDFGTAHPFTVRMKFDRGEVVIRLLAEDAPLHAANFKNLAERKFYNGLRIHRVVPNFVIQGGDPRGDGWGGAGEVVHDQINTLVYKRGMVGMPIAGKDTGGSQFFITHSRQPHLDGNYTIFGEVLSGMDVVDQIEVGDTIHSIEVIQEQKKN